ncbi:hypothetical protein LguiB_020746 [Lonicera macranthoides]
MGAKVAGVAFQNLAGAKNIELVLNLLHNSCPCNKTFHCGCGRKWKLCWMLLSGFVFPTY